jgi:hypothetical protein
MQPKVFIATPTTGGTVKALYATTLAGTVGALVERGCLVETAILNAVDVGKQRDALAHAFLANPANTHLLFIDSDISAPPDLALRLLALDKPIIGAIYARKEAEPGFVVGIREGTQITNGICPVDWFGFGYVAIRRDCLETMRKRCSLSRYLNPFTRPASQTLGFFASLDGVVSEDISFCRRWTEQCEEPLWAYAAADIKHIGDYAYGVPFTEHVKAGNKLEVPAK